ncbi:rho GTPase-activating protein gacO-like [Cynara cardunculus var. scolymus]|uniref:DUF1639 domain-containing protein n=1 Tax=Cynara cardunculus var. scolymus TaxID=59895 RepID=A0A103XCA7_CYNCS|nr:rho GTPase-activating protein gacO-like [Cynara cardunculus var. scolymus]KVH88095.1 Protein of unknown function DUF1639 [Cynara cardunculus var. scolymus]
MASPLPAKSQPLHNFSLPHLKWKNHRSGRSRLAGETSSSSPPHRSPSTPWRESPPPPPPISHAHIPPPLRQSSPSYVSRRPSPLHKQSPMRDSESESEPGCAVSKGIEKPNRKLSSEKSTKSVDNNKGKRSNKICIRFRKNNNIKHDDTVAEENRSSTQADNATAANEEDSLPKTWNLRPRRPPMNHRQSNGGLQKIGSSPLQESRTFHGNNANKQASEVKNNDHNNLGTSKKQKFSIALSRDEIEEDIFSLTGSKPSRRPKKRPRTVQRQLDTLFPGLWLGSITADSYKVSEAPPKA